MEPAASSEYLADDEEPPYSVRRLRQAYLERVRESNRPRRGFFGSQATPSLPYIPEIEEVQRVLMRKEGGGGRMVERTDKWISLGRTVIFFNCGTLVFSTTFFFAEIQCET